MSNYLRFYFDLELVPECACRPGRLFEGTAIAPTPLTPPGAAKSLSVEEKREITQTDHFQVCTFAGGHMLSTIHRRWDLLSFEESMLFWIRNINRWSLVTTVLIAFS